MVWGLPSCHNDSSGANLAGSSLESRENQCRALLGGMAPSSRTANENSNENSNEGGRVLFPSIERGEVQSDPLFIPATSWLRAGQADSNREERVLSSLSSFEQEQIKKYALLNEKGGATLLGRSCAYLGAGLEDVVLGRGELVLALGEVFSSLEGTGALNETARRSCFGSERATERRFLSAPAIVGEQARARVFPKHPAQEIIPLNGVSFQLIAEYRQIGDDIAVSPDLQAGGSSDVLIGPEAQDECKSRAGVIVLFDHSFVTPVPVGYVMAPIVATPLASLVNVDMSKRCLDLSQESQRAYFPKVSLFESVRQACRDALTSERAQKSSL